MLRGAAAKCRIPPPGTGATDFEVRWQAVALVVSVLAAGCGSGGGDPANELVEGQTLKVDSEALSVSTKVWADGEHYAQGRNTFLVEFDPSSTVLDKASAFMPVHGHGTPSAPGITQENDGSYRISDFIFSMPGQWNVTLDITLKNKADKVEFSLDVP